MTVIRTRYAPSPTGTMHVGNLRTALYEYLIAKSSGGDFILRIEDTDQDRFVEGAVEIIYDTLREVGLRHDEGPDVGGPFGPYVQSERRDLYNRYAAQLLESGHAYHCFCSRERLSTLRAESEAEIGWSSGYDRRCRNLDPDESAARAAAGEPSVIRQRMPLDGSTTFEDSVYGAITVDNKVLEDQILLKSDGMPTYNFANVVDDHLMGITHVVRGSEYLSSAPKYNLLYEAFGWEVPAYVHLPLIVGSDGRKLSKRHGATGLADLEAAGYLVPAVVNYVALLGWCPSDNREKMTLPEMVDAFAIDGISKSPAMFDYGKLDWMNGEYLRVMSPEAFAAYIKPELELLFKGNVPYPELLAELLQPRIQRAVQIPGMLGFLVDRLEYPLDHFLNKKNKSDRTTAAEILTAVRAVLADLPEFTRQSVHDSLIAFGQEKGLKTGQLMWPLRVALSGLPVTPGGAVEIAVLLGRQETLDRIDIALCRLDEADRSGDQHA